MATYWTQNTARSNPRQSWLKVRDLLHVCLLHEVDGHLMLASTTPSLLPPPPLFPSPSPSPPLSVPLTPEFQAAGVDLSQPMVATCGSGVTATHIALAAHILGTDIPVYDVCAYAHMNVCIHTSTCSQLSCLGSLGSSVVERSVYIECRVSWVRVPPKAAHFS